MRKLLIALTLIVSCKSKPVEQKEGILRNDSAYSADTFLITNHHDTVYIHDTIFLNKEIYIGTHKGDIIVK